MVKRDETYRTSTMEDAMRVVRCQRPHALASLWINRWELWQATRPLTMAYATACTLIGYHRAHALFSITPLLTAITFGLITGNIMVFNDIVDRYHDRTEVIDEKKKRRQFAYDHTGEIRWFWATMGALIAAGLVALAYNDPVVAVFSSGVWWIGLAYSFVPHWYIAQNALVACCSASPVLCGCIAARQWDGSALVIWAILFGIIMVSEIAKDIEDIEIDPGYKVTIPIVTADDTPKEWQLHWDHRHLMLPWVRRMFDEMPPMKIRTELVQSVKICGGIIAWTSCAMVALLDWPGLISAIPFIMVKPALASLALHQERSLALVYRLIDLTILNLFIALLLTQR